MMPAKDDAERLRTTEAKVLQKLLATPPQPMKKTSEAATPKKRGRPPKVKKDD